MGPTPGSSSPWRARRPRTRGAARATEDTATTGGVMKRLHKNISPRVRSQGLAAVRKPELLPQDVRRALELLDAIPSALVEPDPLGTIEARLERALQRLELLRTVEVQLPGAVEKPAPARAKRPGKCGPGAATAPAPPAHELWGRHAAKVGERAGPGD